MANYIFLSILILLMLSVMGITELRQRILFRKSIQSHLKHKHIFDDLERPYAFYDTYYQMYPSLTKKVDNEPFWIDDKTWSDLNMDALFHKMNYTYTSIGENHLYHVLRLQTTLNQFDIWSQVEKNTTIHEKMVTLLAQLGKQHYPKYNWKAFVTRFHWVYYILSFLPLLSILIGFIHIPTSIFAFLFSLILNMVISMRFNHVIDRNMEDLFFTGRVIYTVNALTKLNLSLPFHYSLNQLNRVNRWRFLLVKVTTIPGYFVLLFKYIFLIDIHLYHILVRRFKENEETIHACYRYIGELDTLLSVKQWRYHHENCQTPVVKSNLKFKGLTHPLIEQAVPNDFDFNQNVLLTGSNASGKSTFMKAIALNLILAQAVQTVTAQQFHYQPGIVKTTMANADDVLSGDSYFMAEIKSLKRLLNFDTSIPHYFFIDEIFKGTNTAERIAASQAVLEYLAQFQGIKVIAATHDIELTRQLHPIYENYHFNETIEQNVIHFDYTIKKGPANTRNALELIRIMDFPLTIYQNAKQHVESFDNKNTDAQY